MSRDMACSAGDCEEFGYYEREVKDAETNRKYYIYLCDGHCSEFDTYHKEGECYQMKRE